MIQDIHIVPDLWKILEVLGTLVAAGGALYFGWLQYHINKLQYEVNERMRVISDYVAINIAPGLGPTGPLIQVKNVGKLNLYIHKYEIGGSTETFERARLIDCAGDISFVIPVPFNPANPRSKMIVKFYLTDESDIRYLYTGGIEVFSSIQQIPQSSPLFVQGTPQQSQAVPQVNGPTVNVNTHVNTWSYKTERYYWEI